MIQQYTITKNKLNLYASLEGTVLKPFKITFCPYLIHFRKISQNQYAVIERARSNRNKTFVVTPRKDFGKVVAPDAISHTGSELMACIRPAPATGRSKLEIPENLGSGYGTLGTTTHERTNVP